MKLNDAFLRVPKERLHKTHFLPIGRTLGGRNAYVFPSFGHGVVSIATTRNNAQRHPTRAKNFKRSIKSPTRVASHEAVADTARLKFLWDRLSHPFLHA